MTILNVKQLILKRCIFLFFEMSLAISVAIAFKKKCFSSHIKMSLPPSAQDGSWYFSYNSSTNKFIVCVSPKNKSIISDSTLKYNYIFFQFVYSQKLNKTVKNGNKQQTDFSRSNND